MELYGFENLTVQVSDRFGFFKPPVVAGPTAQGTSFFDFLRALQQQANAPKTSTTAPKTPAQNSTVTTQPTAGQKLQQVTGQPEKTQGLAKAALVVSGGKAEVTARETATLPIGNIAAELGVEAALVRALFLGEAANSNTEPSLALVAGVVAEPSSGETGQVLRAAAKLFSVVEHVATTRAERIQTPGVLGPGIAAVVTHLESLLGVAQQETVRPAVAQQLLQVARLMSEALPIQALPLVSTLVLQTRSEVQLTRLVQTLEQFFQLPEEVQQEVAQSLQRETSNSSQQTPRILQRFQQLVRQQVPNQALEAPVSEVPVQVSETVPNPSQTDLPQAGPRVASLRESVVSANSENPTNPNEATLASVVRTSALTIAGQRPTQTARQIRLLGPVLAQVVANLSTLGLPLPLATSFRQFLSQLPTAAVRFAEIRAFAARFVRYIPPASPTMVALLRNILHPSANVRFLMVALLRETIQRVPVETANREFVPSLMVLARAKERKFLMVRAEAIRVLLDMGQGQSRGRQDEEAMRALLEEIDLVPLLRDLLNPKNYRWNGPEEVKMGLSLLARAGRYLIPEVRAELLQFALEIAERHRLEEVKMEALGCLLTYQHDLGRVEQRRLLQKGLYLSLMAAVARQYQTGRSNFSNNGPQAVRYGA